MNTTQQQQLFDRFCRNNGLGYRYEHDRRELAWFLGLVEQFRLRGNHSASLLFSQLGDAKIHVDVAGHRQFNAFAGREARLNLVAVTSEALRCLYPLAGILARYHDTEESPSPEMLSRLRVTRWIDSESVDECCQALLQYGPLVPPRAQARHTQIFWHMIDVLLHHELAHLYLGHVGFLRHFGKGMASEARPSAQQSQTEQWHAMEIQADIGVCLYLTALQPHEGEFEVGVLASLVVFFLLYELAPAESNSHPHPLVRLYVLVQRTGNESRYDDDAFNALLDRIKARLGRLQLFESTSNLSLDEVAQRAEEIERVSNSTYLPLFAPYRLDPKGPPGGAT